MYCFMFPFRQGDVVPLKDGRSVTIGEDAGGYWWFDVSSTLRCFNISGCRFSFDEVVWDDIHDCNGDPVEFVTVRDGDIYMIKDTGDPAIYTKFGDTTVDGVVGFVVLDCRYAEVAPFGFVKVINGTEFGDKHQLTFELKTPKVRKDWLVGNIYDINPDASLWVKRLDYDRVLLDDSVVNLGHIYQDDVFDLESYHPNFILGLNSYWEEFMFERSTAYDEVAGVFFIDHYERIRANVDWACNEIKMLRDWGIKI